MNNEQKLYIVYMPKIAAALRELGFKLIKTTPNFKKPQYDIYWFEDTPEIHKAIPTASKMVKERTIK